MSAITRPAFPLSWVVAGDPAQQLEAARRADGVALDDPGHPSPLPPGLLAASSSKPPTASTGASTSRGIRRGAGRPGCIRRRCPSSRTSGTHPPPRGSPRPAGCTDRRSSFGTEASARVPASPRPVPVWLSPVVCSRRAGVRRPRNRSPYSCLLRPHSPHVTFPGCPLPIANRVLRRPSGHEHDSQTARTRSRVTGGQHAAPAPVIDAVIASSWPGGRLRRLHRHARIGLVPEDEPCAAASTSWPRSAASKRTLRTAQATIGALGDDEDGRLIKHALERLAEHLR